MHRVGFENHEGLPIAMLGLTEPVAAERVCMFASMWVTAELCQSRESESLLPERPTEDRGRDGEAGEGWVIAVQKQNGWHIMVALDDEAEGQWSAEKDGERVEGLAQGLGQTARPDRRVLWRPLYRFEVPERACCR